MKPFSVDVAVAREEVLVVCFPEEIESSGVFACFTAMFLMLGLNVDLTRSQAFTNDAETRLNTVAKVKKLLGVGGTIDLLDTLFIKAKAKAI